MCKYLSRNGVKGVDTLPGLVRRRDQVVYNQIRVMGLVQVVCHDTRYVWCVYYVRSCTDESVVSRHLRRNDRCTVYTCGYVLDPIPTQDKIRKGVFV